MQIELSKIHGAAEPIRETWSEEKMQELTESIRDLGVIVPIKVRPNADGYEVIYGHRRTEAARRAGLSHIPAEVEGISDSDSVKQAIAENMIREDMEPFELGKALARLNHEFHLSQEEIGQAFGMGQNRVSEFINLALDPLMNYVNDSSRNNLHNLASIEKKAMATKLLSDLDDRAKVLEVVGERSANIVGAVSQAIRTLSKEDRHAVLDKAKRERLDVDHIQQVAQAVEAANREQKPHIKESILAVRGDAPHYQEMVEQRAGVLGFMDRKQAKAVSDQRERLETYDEVVKEGIGYIRAIYEWMTEYGYDAIADGRFSPEATRFVLRRMDGLVEEYQQRFRPLLDK